MFIAKWSNGIVMWSIPMCRSAAIPRTEKRFMNARNGRIVKKTAAVITTATAKPVALVKTTQDAPVKMNIVHKNRARVDFVFTTPRFFAIIYYGSAVVLSEDRSGFRIFQPKSKRRKQ